MLTNHFRLLNKKMPLKEQIIETLKTVEDPDLLIDIYFLGLIYDIDINEDADVVITMTFTTPLCPSGPDLVNEVHTKVSSLEGVNNATVKVTFEPKWEPSDELKDLMGL